MKPMRVGITMGDPAGIGPEVMLKGLKSLAARDGRPEFTPVVYGTASVVEDMARRLALPLRLVTVDADADWPAVRMIETAHASPPPIGVVSSEAGELAFAAVASAIRDAMAGRIEAIVTGPISKEAINLAGHSYAGHTEILAHLANSPGTCMMLAHGNLRVAHVSTHVALAKVPSLVTRSRLIRVIELTAKALDTFGIAKPRIGVAALNPHAGEGGLFGREDSEVIVPTVAELCARGFEVTGPVAGDTVFVRALAGEFDAVIAMFHDQGHIPIKLLGFKVDPRTGKWAALSGVNITLGLPFVRTSVDHGTAFDIAGKGIASEQSFVEAVDAALQMVQARL
ncbi:MAG: 4-hydroxythreonine-4-phosphate dehydrogenase PdxA [Rhizobiales bacterium]|nr:4-hydroxythreonine-4-phosphate dehydrogenase PdxA [Hyphomicrobiales bacterium]